MALPYLKTPSRSASEIPPFSALELRDRVVIMLLFDQVVYEEQVALAWQLWQQMGQEGVKEPLWRVLTLFPEIDRELVYAEAARVYGFETARISRSRAIGLIHRVEEQVTASQWDQLVELRVIPVTESEQVHTHRARLVFATQDPTRPDVHRLLPTLDLGGFELRYAPEQEIAALLIEAFPQRYKHLRGLSGISKDFLANVVIDNVEAELVEIPSDDAVLDLFDEVLAEAIHKGATDLCLMPTPTDEMEVYLQFDDILKCERVIDDISAQDIIGVIRRVVIQDHGFEDGRIHKAQIERQIDGDPLHFRVSAVPPSDEVPSECIVVRVL
jgi:type IV pilus assembly protein PilB